MLQRMEIYQRAPSKRKESEPKDWITGMHPVDKVQVDVKYVLSKYITKELQDKRERFY